MKYFTLILCCLCMIATAYADDSVAVYDDATPVPNANSNVINASDDDVVKDDSRVFHVYEDVDLVSTLKFDYGKPRIVIKSVYPQLASETDKDGVNTFNQDILDIVNEEIENFKTKVTSFKSTWKNMG